MRIESHGIGLPHWPISGAPPAGRSAGEQAVPGPPPADSDGTLGVVRPILEALGSVAEVRAESMDAARGRLDSGELLTPEAAIQTAAAILGG